MNKKVALALFLGAIFVSLLFAKGYISIHANNRIIKQDVKVSVDTTSHWIDVYNEEHAKNIALQEDAKTANELHGAEIKKAANDIRVRDKQIEHLQQIVVQYKGGFISQIDTSNIKGDTSGRFDHKDQYSSFSGVVVGSKAAVKYSITIPVELTAYWKRSHTFLGIGYGRIEHYIDGHSANPNAHLDSLQDVRILQKQPSRFGIGPYVGVSLTDNYFKPSVGIALTYSLIRF